MESGDRDFHTLKQELESLLEERISDLLCHVKVAQGVTRQILAAEEDIRRQQLLQASLEQELPPLEEEAEGLQAENSVLESKVEKLRDNVMRLRVLKGDLTASLTSLKNDLHE
jgi:chromosome segregation ATPase